MVMPTVFATHLGLLYNFDSLESLSPHQKTVIIISTLTIWLSSLDIILFFEVGLTTETQFVKNLVEFGVEYFTSFLV